MRPPCRLLPSPLTYTCTEQGIVVNGASAVLSLNYATMRDNRASVGGAIHASNGGKVDSGK